MKMRPRKCSSTSIQHSRWLAYAGAGAATAFLGSTSAEAKIHYSGRVDYAFGGDEAGSATFPLDQPGEFIAFKHSLSNGKGAALFRVQGLVSDAFRGPPVVGYDFVARIHSGRYFSKRTFISAGDRFGVMTAESAGSRGPWKSRGMGFVGFRFNNGAGVQYGWARVQMGSRAQHFAFKVFDYAYADPGEPIAAGLIGASNAHGPGEGSLGLLAMGAAGLAIWRNHHRRDSA
jgi:hypothetical protein